MAELGAKMAQGGARLVILRPIGELSQAFWGLGNELCRNDRSLRMSATIAFWLHFRVLGGLVGNSWGYLKESWPEVGVSWAILPQFETFLAACWDKDGEDEPR